MVMHKPHSFPVDIWSFGISILELANGEPPNRDNALKALTQVALKGIAQPLRDPTKWHRSFTDFIHDTLKWDPIYRPTAAALLTHGFLKIKSKQMEMKSLLLRIFTSEALETLTFI